MEAPHVLRNEIALLHVRRAMHPLLSALQFAQPALYRAFPAVILLLAQAFWLGSVVLSTATAQYAPAGTPSYGRQFRSTTKNFVVTAEDSKLARRVGQEAERFRKELAIQWLGHELGPWRDKCPIMVEVGMHAGGETSFAFVSDGSGRGVPISWQMKIFGPPDRLLDAVLPHEITHTIFATHFGRPLPRWADEGACTTVEHESERRKNHQMLMDFLGAQPSRGIPFNRMFTMRNYPHDILPLYAQGYSLAKFLIMQKDRRYFLDYVNAGMAAESPGHELRAWDQTTEKYYGFENLSDLQIAWLQWVKNGSEVVSVASNRNNIQEPGPSKDASTYVADVNTHSSMEQDTTNSVAKNLSADDGSWYTKQMNSDGNRFAANRKSIRDKEANPDAAGIAESIRQQYKTDTIWR